MKVYYEPLEGWMLNPTTMAVVHYDSSGHKDYVISRERILAEDSLVWRVAHLRTKSWVSEKDISQVARLILDVKFAEDKPRSVNE